LGSASIDVCHLSSLETPHIGLGFPLALVWFVEGLGKTVQRVGIIQISVENQPPGLRFLAQILAIPLKQILAEFTSFKATAFWRISVYFAG
jgi:hypothetical protein